MSDDERLAKKTKVTSAADNNSSPHDARVFTPKIPQDNGRRPSIASSPPVLPPSEDICATIEGNSDETTQPMSESDVKALTNPMTPPPKPARRRSPRVEVHSSPPVEPRSDIPHSGTTEDADDAVIPATPDPAEVRIPSSPPLPSAAGQKRPAEDMTTRSGTKFVRLDESEADLIGGPAAGQTPTEFTKRLQREKSKMELDFSMKVSDDEKETEVVDDGKATEQDATGDDSDASTIVQEAKSGQETSSPNDALMKENRNEESAAGE